MHTHPETRKQHAIAIAATLWLMVAGVCVVLANAWAMGL